MALPAPDLMLLRTKLILECEHICPPAIFQDARSSRPTSTQELWILDSEVEGQQGSAQREDSSAGIGREKKGRSRVKERWKAQDWRGDASKSAGRAKGSRSNPIDLTKDEGYDSDALKAPVSGCNETRRGETEQAPGVIWVSKGTAVHSAKDASTGGGIGESKHSLDLGTKPAWTGDMKDKSSLGPQREKVERRERFVVMDCWTWNFTKVGAQFEAEALADNPGIDAGNGIWLFLNDHVDSNIQRAMQVYVEKNRRKTTTEDDLGLQYGDDVFKSERGKLEKFKVSLGLGDNVPDGTPMYFYLCKAVKDIREREERQRRLKKEKMMMDEERLSSV